jgi:nascent polypeptide-associated complex subunit beta
MQAIPGIEEVNFFKDNGEVIHFVQPKVQAAIASKTFMISGNSETVSLESLMPGILTQMGDLQALQRAAAAQMAAAGAAAGEAAPELAEDDDEAPPELVETD